MEQCSPFGWTYYNEEEGMMCDMRQYILQSRLELEATVIAAQDEIMKKEEELIHMKELLMMTVKERDDAQSKLQKLMLEKLILQQQLQQLQQQPQPQPQPQQQQQTTHQESQKKSVSLSNTNTTSSSECDESSIISSPQGGSSGGGSANSPALQQPAMPPQIAATLASSCRPLPEKGKLLKAVMEAGPLLQTLLLAGPLPQWQHPPPPLESIEIPPVTITTSNSSPRKRGVQNFDCSMISSPKYPRVV